MHTQSIIILGRKHDTSCVHALSHHNWTNAHVTPHVQVVRATHFLAASTLPSTSMTDKLAQLALIIAAVVHGERLRCGRGMGMGLVGASIGKRNTHLQQDFECGAHPGGCHAWSALELEVRDFLFLVLIIAAMVLGERWGLVGRAKVWGVQHGLLVQLALILATAVRRTCSGR